MSGGGDQQAGNPAGKDGGEQAMNETAEQVALMRRLSQIAVELKSQDNRCTAEPMFCVQEKKRDIGFDAAYSEGETVWLDMQSGDYQEVEPETEGAEEFGYKDRWETVMVCFTEEGCTDYLRQNGHNHPGGTRIYVESFRRCDEMIAIRRWLMSLLDGIEIPAKAKGGGA